MDKNIEEIQDPQLETQENETVLPTETESTTQAQQEVEDLNPSEPTEDKTPAVEEHSDIPLPAEPSVEDTPVPVIPNLNFIPYNTDMERLKLPEYGRKIQELIEYCKTLPDRGERTACAIAIADVMARLFPNQLGEKGDRKKIWDHINIMAGFDLDIDFPVEVISSEELNPKPDKLEYDKKPIRYRHYGRTLEKMVEKVAEMEDGELKDHLLLLIANQMKKQLLAHNKEGVSDAKVLKDLAEYSRGRIVLDPNIYHLHEYNELNPKQPQGKKKRKK